MAEVFRECWFLVGPTATGKSDVGLILAEHLNAEIVSLDSMALYRGMDIGTAKPSAEARVALPHHLIDIIGPHEEYSLAEYVDAAETVCRDIISREKTPLFVGGTGLYLRGVLRGVFDGPPADWDFRRAMQAEIERKSPAAVYEHLKQIDPVAAAALHPNDTRRVIRALEVHHLSGRPLSDQQQQPLRPAALRPRNVFWLSPPREWLYERINKRVEAMFADGLIAEVKGLLSAANPLSRTAQQALGYKETIEFLQRSFPQHNDDLDETIATIQTRTRQFAKRQHTWFRNLEECKAVEISGNESPSEIAERLLRLGTDNTVE